MYLIEKFFIILNVVFLIIQLFLMGTLETPIENYFFSLFVPVIITYQYSSFFLLVILFKMAIFVIYFNIFDWLQ